MRSLPRKPRMEVIPPPGRGELVVAPAPMAVSGQGARSQKAAARPGMGSVLAYVPGVPTLVGLWFYLLDTDAPVKHRLAIMASMIYLVYPADAIADVFALLGGVGLVDDLAVFTGLAMFLGSKNLNPYREKARRWLKGLPLEDEVEPKR